MSHWPAFALAFLLGAGGVGCLAGPAGADAERLPADAAARSPSAPLPGAPANRIGVVNPTGLPALAPGAAPSQGGPYRQHAIASAHPLASEAGLQMLDEGGSALDAAIAAQMVLTLVEPHSSGIGGGAFMLLSQDGRVEAHDGRETAPGKARSDAFLKADGKPMPFIEAVVGGHSVGTPGVLRMLESAHRRHGRLPWARLFAPAIRLAEEGYSLTPRVAEQVQRDGHLRQDPVARRFFYQADGQAVSPLKPLRNPAMAAVLRLLAEQGSGGFYQGAVARDMVQRVQGSLRSGSLSLDDLQTYQPLQREALCHLWLARWRVCGFPPPTSGHLTLMQMLLMLERDLPPEASATAAWLHRYTEASRLAYADRDRYIADPAFVQAPGDGWGSLTDRSYLDQRRLLIGERSMNTARPGRPGQAAAAASQAHQPEYGTSHLSVVDAHGQAVALTSSIEATWGSRIMSDGGTGLEGGFLLNNTLTDFSLSPYNEQGLPVLNRMEPLKRPRSSMAPTLVFDALDGSLVMSLGSPGGPGIIHYVAQALVATLVWQLGPGEAVNRPHAASFNGPTLLERGRFEAATVQALKDMGHEVIEAPLVSGTHLLLRREGQWWGAADPRRDGAVRGR